MDPMHMLADTYVRQRMRQQFHSPEVRHLAARVGARRGWHRRFTAHVRRLKTLASTPANDPVSAPGRGGAW